jgi:hypothetical protein
MTLSPEERLDARSTPKPVPAAARPAPARDAGPAPAAALQRALAGPAVRPADVLALQRAVGNRAVQRMLGSRAPVQAKLTVNAPNDVYEDEANRVASQVVASLDQPAASAADAAVQRTGEDEDRLAMTKPLVQRMLQRDPAMDEDDEVPGVMAKPSLQREGGDGSFAVEPEVESAIQGARGGGQAMDGGTRGAMEGAFGVDFGGVRIHTGAHADSLNRAVQARAFTTGQDIFFRQGEYDPGSSGGKELLAHELTHVVQQNGPALARKDRDPDQG